MTTQIVGFSKAKCDVENVKFSYHTTSPLMLTTIENRNGFLKKISWVKSHYKGVYKYKGHIILNANQEINLSFSFL